MTNGAQDVEELPGGWASCPLREFVRTTIGGDWGLTPEQADGIAVIEASVIRGTEFRDWDLRQGATAARRAISSSKLASRQLADGDLVLEVSGGGPQQPVGRTVLIDRNVIERSPVPLTCSNFCRRLQLSDSVKPAFVWWSLRLLYAEGEFDRFQTQTTNLRNLNVNEFLDGVTIRVAPLAEQKRIVAQVEQVLVRVDAARERLAKVPKILKRFRQSVLAAACSGRLTREWRGQQPQIETATELIARLRKHRLARYEAVCLDAKAAKQSKPSEFDNIEPNLRSDLDTFELPEEWTWVDLRFLMTVDEPFCYGVVQPGADDPSGNFLVRAGDLKNGTVSVADLRRIPGAIDRAYERSRLKGGEILVTVVGAGIGSVAIAPKSCVGFNIARAVAKIPIRDVCAEYVFYWLSSGTASAWMFGDAREVARPTLNLEQLKTIPIPLPPLAEQDEIVRRVKSFFKLANTIERRTAAAIQRVDKVTQAVLAKAFRGDLVPTEAELAKTEGRDYETAAALLERIRRERAAVAVSEPRAKPTPNGRPKAARRIEAATANNVAANGSATKTVKPPCSTEKIKARPADSADPTDAEPMRCLREAFADSVPRDREQAIRDVARALGYARLSPRIRETASSLIRAAVRRGILAKENGQYELLARTAADYTRDQLIDSLLSSINGVWTDRQEAIRQTARHLGHRRAGPAFQAAMKSAINGALRRQRIESNGNEIRRVRN